ncbi:MAG: hypothetical protein EXR72_00720 [Myxococcales bacterium]|nr:hypothetical protein [Myxococcales bacterium]
MLIRRLAPFYFAFALALALGPACAAVHTIPGTTVADSRANRDLLQVCEKYRRALEERDAPTLLAMADPSYFEDSGTPKGDDDYGYEGLKKVIATRLQSLRSLRFNVEYRSIEVKGTRAQIEIRYDASFQVATDMGDRWERKQNDKRLDLAYNGHRWLFVAGM